MLAAAIGVDRAVEGNVGGIVLGDDGARLLDRDLGPERREFAERTPAVILADALLRLVAATGIDRRAAAAPALGIDAVSRIGDRISRRHARRHRHRGGTGLFQRQGRNRLRRGPALEHGAEHP